MVLYSSRFHTEISLLRKKMPVLPTVYAENRKEPYGIKSYIFLCINNQKGHLLLYNYVTHKTYTYERRCPYAVWGKYSWMITELSVNI